MSIFVFSGAAQFAALSVLAAGGGALAAITAGMLMNARWLPANHATACAAVAPMPFTPPGVPIIAASLAALVGLRRA
jgi:hypothetical protein